MTAKSMSSKSLEKLDNALSENEWYRVLDEGLTYGDHAGAAIALYGQSFGFTHEDVTVLRALLPILTASGPINSHRDELVMIAAAQHIPSLSARIAALLPPKDVRI